MKFFGWPGRFGMFIGIFLFNIICSLLITAITNSRMKLQYPKNKNTLLEKIYLSYANLFVITRPLDSFSTSSMNSAILIQPVQCLVNIIFIPVYLSFFSNDQTSATSSTTSAFSDDQTTTTTIPSWIPSVFQVIKNDINDIKDDLDDVIPPFLEPRPRVILILTLVNIVLCFTKVGCKISCGPSSAVQSSAQTQISYQSKNDGLEQFASVELGSKSPKKAKKIRKVRQSSRAPPISFSSSALS